MSELRSPFATRFARANAVDLSTALSVLADPSRLLIIHHLNRRGWLTGAELGKLIGLSQPTTSHHLQILKNAGLVVSRQVGVTRPYALDRSAVSALADALLLGGGQ